MWRFFRLGIKSSICPGNQTHFRIIGTTCSNADCDEKIEDVESNDVVFSEKVNLLPEKKNFASVASKKFQNDLQRKENILHKKFPSKWEGQNPKLSDNPLREIDWNQYLNSNDNAEGKNKSKSSKFSKQTKHHSKNKSDAQHEFNNKSDFGTLSKNDREYELLPEDVDDAKDDMEYEDKPSTQQYGKKMLKLCKERKLKEALEVLEVEMKELNVMPSTYCYNILINGCGKAGYTKKAFYLYYQMKRMGLKVEKFAYTGLFNACANSPFKTEGLEYAGTLRKQLKDKRILLHPITYHAMIKAFGHCNDITTAFEIVDEMITDKHLVTSETMNFLLQSCVTDKENGFRHALMVWRKMRSLKLIPDIYSYNLLLRCVKECNAGDSRLYSQLLEGHVFKREEYIREAKTIYLNPKNRKVPLGSIDTNRQYGKKAGNKYIGGVGEGQEANEHKSFCQIGSNNEIIKVELQENMEMEICTPEVVLKEESKEVLPNLLSRKIHPGNVITIKSLENKDERLWLLGGVAGILENMRKDRVKPTNMTFTYILESLPSNKEIEESLLATMENCNVVPDVIFCNKLIHRRCMRGCFVEAKDVLEFMQKHHVCMDLITFGCLAIGCSYPSDIKQLLRDMKMAGFKPNEEIMETFIKNSIALQEYGFVIELLQRLKSSNITPTESILKTLEKARYIIKKKLVKQECEKSETVSRREKRKQEEMKLFIIEYNYWLKGSSVEMKDHPWAQYGYQEHPGKQVAKVMS